ncbi:hypothetical protein [Nitrosophilus labii]|uniref:hypothetical protein n=1 Tax=Nitrosophilus labii TaxID=2706014 RepID=UPI0016572E1D|nr:hypothetical protein [Nitrosophilus labii]
MPGSYGSGGSGGYGSGGRFATQNVDLKTNNAAAAEGSAYKKPKNILNALSEIQRYYVLESRASEDLPKEYFTIEQIWDFFKVGFKSGIVEGLFFVTLLPFLQTVYPSFKVFFFGQNITYNEQLIFDIGSYLPILASTLFMIFLSKYYEGDLTKRAIFSFLNGRSATFILKGVGIYMLFNYLQKLSYQDPDFIYTMIDYTKWFVDIFVENGVTPEALYQYYYRFIIPALDDAGKEILFSMLLFAFFPYLTIFYKGYLRNKSKYTAKQEYENY